MLAKDGRRFLLLDWCLTWIRPWPVAVQEFSTCQILSSELIVNTKVTPFDALPGLSTISPDFCMNRIFTLCIRDIYKCSIFILTGLGPSTGSSMLATVAVGCESPLSSLTTNAQSVWCLWSWFFVYFFCGLVLSSPGSPLNRQPT